MAISYDDWKKQYEGMTTEQQKNYANMVKGNATAEAYAKQYIQEKQNAGSFGTQTANSYTNTNQSTNTSSSNNYSSNSNNQNGSTYDYSSNNTGSNNNNNTWTSNTWNTNTGNTGNTTSSWSPLSDWKNGNGWTYWKFTFDADEYLDESKFWKSNWEITVKEWTAAQTGRPDYEIETKERLTEMVNNLNTYWDSNPEFFNDRETFNRVFEYNTRQSQAQRDLLDSYWKKAQDYKKASSYNNSASFTSDLDSWNVSESEFEALKKYNQDVYIKWQKEMQDKLNAAIANLANPFSIDDMTTALNKIVEKFNLQAWDPYDIIWWWNQMMEKTWAWDSMNEAKKHFTAADDAIAQIKRIQSNYSSSTGWNQSDTLVASRLQKALLPYETLLSNELSAWQHWQSLYNTQLGTANQYAQTIQMQAKEDERIFQQKIKALWFAMDAYSYRTPEQQAQLQLQVQSIQNDMSLLQQSKQNDLALYNMAATAKLQNQLEAELSNLDVADPLQQRANLNRVVGQYFEQFWDIIQRSQSQVVDDVLAYAKEHWVSVGKALSENFIKPLQSKTEYKNALKAKYPSPKSESDKWSYTVDEEWNIKVQYTWSSQLDLEAIRAMWGSGTWKMRTERNNNPTAMTSDVARSLWGVEWEDYIVWDAFQDNPNLHTAYLLGDPIETTIRLLDRAATTGRWAFYTKGWKQRWTHTAMTDEAWLNLSAEEKKNVVLKMLHNEWGDISKMAYYNWQWQWGNLGDVTLRDWTTYDSKNAPTYNSLTYDQQNTVKWLLNLSINPTTITKRQYWDNFEKILTAAQELNPNWSSADYWQADKAKKEWNTSSKNGSNSRNATAAATAKEIYDMADTIWNTTFKDWNALMNFLKNRTSEENYLKLQVNMQTMASEFAWALKGWNAAPTEKEIDDAKDLLAASFSKWGMKASAIQIIKQLYNKNVTEADNYRAVTLEKPNPIWIGEMPEFMENVVWLNLSDYYNYKWVKEQYWGGAASWTNVSQYDDFITYMNN